MLLFNFTAFNVHLGGLEENKISPAWRQSVAVFLITYCPVLSRWHLDTFQQFLLMVLLQSCHTQSYRQDRGYKHYVKCSTSNCLLLYVFLQLLLENIMENTDNIILSLFTNIPKIWFHSVLLGSFICGGWGWGDHSDKCLWCSDQIHTYLYDE